MALKTNIYSVAIVGAGRIAAGFDTPRSRAVLTHAHAVVNNKRLTLAGITDTNEARGKREARKWKTDFYPTMEEMLERAKPDIVVIATPDKTHADILLQVLRSRPGIIVCEKPVASAPDDISKIRAAVKESGIPVIVNFRRRFDPTVHGIQRDILHGHFGKVLSASVHYTKGLLHNGSHAIDLARYFFGEMTSSKAHFTVDDFPEGSPSVGGVAAFERCPQFYLIAGDERCFSLFEFEILLQKKRLRFVDDGFSLVSQNIVSDPVFKGYRVLGNETVRKTGLIRSMSLLMENAVAVLDGKEKPTSPLEEAIETERTCFRLKEGL
ncbi:MAG: Gfo/Idh/MocA family oxidoreductase [bacterium]|nr:Gfo/Idh/MocA family oxidoreductase [bacterium]